MSTITTPPPVSREQFIPLRKSELVDALASQPGVNAHSAAQFRRFCQLVDGLIHRQCQQLLEELKDDYAPFDPDADTRGGKDLSPQELEAKRERLFAVFEQLLTRGNFVRLSKEQIDQAVEACSHWGMHLHVDFNVFDRLEVFVRGDTVDTRFRRATVHKWKIETIEVPIFRRLAVILRLKPTDEAAQVLDTHDVYIKLFKDIPKMDLDMLLPGTQVKMTLLDRMKIAVPTLSGVGLSLGKLIPGAIAAMTTGVYGMLAFLGLLGGTLGYGVRSFFGYLNTRQKYQLNLTQSLYYQNLDNNAGAIHRLLDEAEEQENREAMLAYYFLWHHAPAEGWTPAELDGRIEEFLHAHAGRLIDFEVDDALAKLFDFEVIQKLGDGRIAPLPIEQALAALERRWSKLPGAPADACLVA